MGAPKGNQFWKARATNGRKRIFQTPEQLWKAACEYFQWVEDNPLWEQKAFCHQGEVTKTDISKMRAMTLEGLCLFLTVNLKYLRNFKQSLDLETEEGKDFSLVIENITAIIKTQKFEGASAGLLNSNIIARDLGLKDANELDLKSSDGSMTPTRYTAEQYQAAKESLGVDGLD